MNISSTIYTISLIRTGKTKRCITTVRFVSGFNMGFNQNLSTGVISYCDTKTFSPLIIKTLFI